GATPLNDALRPGVDRSAGARVFSRTMCCFSQPTEVRGTRIFARKTGPTRQALVYQMEYAAKSPTAMILPLPLALPAGERSISWKDLKAYPQFFADLASGYPAEESHGLFERSAKSAVP